MEKNSPTTNSQTSTKPKKHTQDKGKKSSSMPHTKSKRKTSVILGGLILKKVIREKIGYKIKENVLVKSFPGATVDCMSYHIQPSLKKKPEQLIFHFGINNLSEGETAEEVSDQIMNLAESVNTHDTKVIISSLIPRKDECSDKVEQVNRLLESNCEHHRYIDFLNQCN